MEQVKRQSKRWIALNWVIWLIFFLIGVLNVFLVHVVPGVLYILFSLIYFPPMIKYLREEKNFKFSSLLKVILAFMVLWIALAAGDLFDSIEKAML